MLWYDVELGIFPMRALFPHLVTRPVVVLI